MLTLSGTSIRLNKSIYFIRIACLLHAFAIFMVWNTSLSIFFKITLAIFLAYRLYTILYKPSLPQYLPFEQINFQAKKWVLHNREGSALLYDKLTIILEAGLFFLLELRQEDDTNHLIQNSKQNNKKVYMIFFDQLSAEDYRTLRLLEKIY